MAVLITLADGEPIVVAPVNANFVALNTEVATAMVCLYASATQVGNIGTGEDTLHSFTLRANSLPSNGSGLFVRFAGRFAANANAKTLKFYVGAESTQINLTTAAPNDKIVTADFQVMRTATTLWNAYGHAFLSSSASLGTGAVLEAGGAFPVSGTVTSWASDQTVKFTGTGTATDDITLFYVNVWKFEAP